MQFVNQKPEKSGVIVEQYCSITIITRFRDIRGGGGNAGEFEKQICKCHVIS